MLYREILIIPLRYFEYWILNKSVMQLLQTTLHLCVHCERKFLSQSRDFSSCESRRCI